MQTRIDHRARTARYQFDSLGDLHAYLTATPATWSLRSSQKPPRGYDWDFNTSYAAAVDLTRTGWLEGAQKVQEALEAFPTRTPAPDTRTDVYGFRPHVPRFCAGAPDSMIRHTNVAETGAGRVLTLAVSICANAHTSATCMSHFGVAVAQYINQLETDGTRVELYATMQDSFKGNWSATWAIRLKNADQPLDLAVIAFAIGHPGFFRRLGFALIERAPVPQETGYGYSGDTTLDGLIDPPPGTVILNGMKDADRHAPTAAKGLEYVTRQIEKALQAQEL